MNIFIGFSYIYAIRREYIIDLCVKDGSCVFVLFTRGAAKGIFNSLTRMEIAG